MLAPPVYNFSPPFTIPLKEISSDGHTLVGGKAMKLAIIERDLQLPIPKGFAITTNAFYYFIEFNDLRKSIDERLSKIDINSTASLDTTSNELIEIMMNAQIPSDIEEAICQSFKSLKGAEDRDIRIAMRSSAVAVCYVYIDKRIGIGDINLSLTDHFHVLVKCIRKYLLYVQSCFLAQKFYQ